MTDFNQSADEIRQFLLGQLPEERAERLEDRIFAESDFAEEVRIIEGELILDYQAGNLSPAERDLFVQKYLSSPAGLRAVESESVFYELVRAKSADSPQVSVAIGDSSSAAAETGAPESGADPPSAPREIPEQAGWLSRVRALFTERPVWAYTAVLSGLLLLTIGGVLIQRLFRPPVGDATAQAERQAREDELARLNRDAAALNGREVATVDLTPTQRYGGAMPRVVINNADPDGLIKLRLNLMQSGAARYRALFLDDRRRELFAIQNLAAQNTLDGPQIQLFVPAKYLKRGDYQIDLSVSDNNQEPGGYAFRVVENR
ncbi:MAG TPA: hypothetical protein VN256_06825 [Pyrinomonadaceae bacterium]|nr:hypothetical protein [Pyrinomonadaceae bacterium]